MTDESAKLSLLPNGFVDLLPPKAEAEAQAISKLMEKFKSFGYARVKPPLLEFEESLLGASTGGAKLAPETFRLMDPISHRMLGVRSDITPQIARIAASRLSTAPRPLRLTYANDALRTRGSQMRTERQFTQVGCEIIGDAGLQTDIEICVLAVLGLKALGLTDVTLDFTIPGFVARAVKNPSPEILEAVARRDRDALAKTAPILAQVIVAGKMPAALQSLKFDKDMKADIDHLCAVYHGVADALKDLKITDVSLSADVLEQAGFEYQKIFGFTLFSRHVHGELGRGGAYDVRFGDHQETAKGFTLYMDTLGKAAAPQEPKDCLFVPVGVTWSQIEALQAEGWTILRGNERGQGQEQCSHIFENGKIIKRKKD